MNIVWPVTAFYLSILVPWVYFRTGRQGKQQDRANPSWRQIALAASHCGAGCALADIVAEFTVFGLGLTIYGSELWASYVWDFVAAWLLGIAFQYFTIKPMRNLSPLEGLWAAIKADTLSILAFQVGMYAWMALVFFKFFPAPHLHPTQPGYWLMMQIGMICGFATACPMNRLLVKAGWKEAMG